MSQEERNRLDIFHKFFLLARQTLLFSSPINLNPPKFLDLDTGTGIRATSPNNLEPPKILDLGTGTGIWAVEVSQAHPHAVVLGVDINMIQPKWIPQTMKPPIELDLEGPWENIADDWDLIHMRALLGSIESWDDLYRKAYRHLKPGLGYIEQVEIDWLPRDQNDECITHGALYEWTEKLLLAMDRYSCSMRLDHKRIQQQLESAGFTNVNESILDVCYSPWSDVPHEKEVARWFNIGLSHALTALSYKPMIEHLDMSKDKVDQLCHDVFQEIRSLRLKFHCKMYIWTAMRPAEPIIVSEPCTTAIAPHTTFRDSDFDENTQGGQNNKILIAKLRSRCPAIEA